MSEDPKRAANRPFAAAIRRARHLANLTLDDWATRLSETTRVPVSKDMAHDWESGVAPAGGYTVVPAYALEAARRVLGRGLEELMGGEPEQGVAGRLAALEARMDVFEALRERMAVYETRGAERIDRLDTVEALVEKLVDLPEIQAALERAAGLNHQEEARDSSPSTP